MSIMYSRGKLQRSLLTAVPYCAMCASIIIAQPSVPTEDGQPATAEQIQADIDALLRPEYGHKLGGETVAIRRVATHGRTAVPPLVQEYHSADYLHRKYILRCLGMIGNPDALDFMDSIIHEGGREAADAARSYSPDHKERLLPTLLAHIPPRGADRTWYSPVLVHAWVPKPQRAEHIIDALARDDLSFDQLQLLEISLANPTGRATKLSRDRVNQKQVVEFWRHWLERNVDRTQTEWITEAYEEADDTECVMAAHRLVELDDPAVIPVLIDLLDDPVVEVRFHATYALGQWSDVWHLRYGEMDRFKEHEDCFIEDIRIWWEKSKDNLPKTKPTSIEAQQQRATRRQLGNGILRKPYCTVPRP